MTAPGGRNEVGTAYVVIRGITKDVKKDIIKSFQGAFKDVNKDAKANGVIAGRNWAKGFNLGVKSEGLDDGITRAWRNMESDASSAGRRAGERYASSYNSAIKRAIKQGGTLDDEAKQTTKPRVVTSSGSNKEEAARQRETKQRQQSEQKARDEAKRAAPTGGKQKNETRRIITKFESVGDKTLKASLVAIRGLLMGMAYLSAAAFAGLVSQAVIGGLGALAAGLSKIGGILLMLPAAATAFASVLATIKIGVSGIGDALKAGNSAAESAGQDAIAQQKAITSAINNRENAEYSVQQAQQNRIRTQKQYTDAVKEATRSIEDMNLKLKGAALDEEDASIAVARAKERLANMPAGSTALDWREANNELKKAQLNLQTVRVDNKRLSDDTDLANRKGVQGSDQVVAAKQAMDDANHQLIQSQKQLVEANQAVAEAMKDSGSAASAYNKALANLSPNAQAFVKTLLGLKSTWSDLKNTVQDNMFAGLDSSITNLAQKMLPSLQVGLGAIATSLNGVAKDIMATFSTDRATSGFQIVLQRVADLIDKMRPGIVALVGAWMNLTTVGSEFFAGFGKGFTDGAQKFERWTSNFDHMRTIIGGAVKALGTLWDVIKTIGSAIGMIFQAALPYASQFADAVRIVGDDMKKTFALGEGKNGLDTFFKNAAAAATALAPAITPILDTIVTLGGLLAGLGRDMAPGFVDFFKGLAEGVKNLQPGLEVVGPKLSGLFSALGAVLPSLGTTVSQLFTAFSPWIDIMRIFAQTILPVVVKLIGDLAPLLSAMAPMIIGLVAAWKGMLVVTKVANGIEEFRKAIEVVKTWTITSKIASAATKAWAGIQAAFNLIMSANPIVLVGLAIAGLVAAIVIAYKNSKTFRDICQSVWEVIKKVADIVWKGLVAAFNAVKDAIQPVIDFIKKWWDILIFGLGPIGIVIGVITQLIKHWDLVKAGIEAVGKVFTWLWQNIAVPAFNGIKAVIEFWWNGVQLYFNVFKTIIADVGKVVLWLWQNIIVPAFDAIKKVISDAWAGVNVVFGWFKDGFKSIGDMAGQAKDWIVDHFNQVIDFFKGLPGKIAQVATGMWDGIKDSFKAMMNWIIDGWNKLHVHVPGVDTHIPGVGKIGDFDFGLPQLPRLAQGGLLSGPGSGTSDSIVGVNGKGVPTARVSNGEFVVNAEATKKWLSLLQWLNGAGGGALASFAAGGLIGLAGGGQAPAAPSAPNNNQAAQDVQAPANIAQQAVAQINAALKQAQDAIGGLITALTTFVNNVAVPMFDNLGKLWTGFGANIVDVITKTVQPAFNALGGGLGAVQQAFTQGVANIGQQWQGLQKAAGDPVKFVIDTVFNQGLIGMWNSVSDMLGTKKMVPYVAKFATGGYVSGAGGPKDDKIPAVLSNGEFVLNAAATKAAGIGNLTAYNNANGKGGPRGMFGGGRRLPFATGGLADTNSPAFQALKRGHEFAAKNANKTYIWGGQSALVGTDCSGWISSIADVILGGTGAVRKWATGAFPGGGDGNAPTATVGGQTWAGGLGAGFSAGVSSPHTAGTFSGVPGLPTINTEDGGAQSPSMSRYGQGATGADDPQFPGKWHLPIIDGQFMHAAGGGGGVDLQGLVDALVKPAVDKMMADARGYAGGGEVSKLPLAVATKFKDAALSKIQELVKKATQYTGAAITGGGGAERWRPMAIAALKRNGFKATKEEQDAMIAQINTESSGNPSAMQTVQDVNSGGNEAAGLLQIAKGTWPSVRDPSLPDDRLDPWANMNAALRYIKQNKGGDLLGTWGHGHGYDSGGILPPGLTLANNKTKKPEAILNPSQWQTAAKAVDQVEQQAEDNKNNPAVPAIPPGTVTNPPTPNGPGTGVNSDDLSKELANDNIITIGGQKFNFSAGDRYLQQKDWATEGANLGKDAIKEVVGQFLDPIGLGGLANMGIDQAFQPTLDQIARAKQGGSGDDVGQYKDAEKSYATEHPNEGNPDAGDQPQQGQQTVNNDNKLANTINITAADPRKAVEEVKRYDSQRSNYSSRYVNG